MRGKGCLRATQGLLHGRASKRTLGVTPCSAHCLPHPSTRTWPTSRSARVRVGSTVVPTPIRPPGTAYCSGFCSANSDTMRERMGMQRMAPLASLVTTPGRTSTSWPMRSTPCWGRQAGAGNGEAVRARCQGCRNAVQDGWEWKDEVLRRGLSDRSGDHSPRPL